MRSLVPLLVIAGLAAADPPAPPAAPAAADDGVSGLWVGQYDYPKQQYPSVKWALVLRLKDGVLTGKVLEPNNFGDAAVEYLSADIVGELSGAAVKFYHRYDGTGGVNHVVIYSGTLDAQRHQVDGTWEIKGQWGSSFSMHRIDTYHPVPQAGGDPPDQAPPPAPAPPEGRGSRM